MKKLLMLGMLLLVSGCLTDSNSDSDKPKLDTNVYKFTGAHWPETTIYADYGYKFLSYVKTTTGITVTVSWNTLISNTGDINYRIKISRFTYEGLDGFQIAEYYPIPLNIVDVTIEAGKSRQDQGNFNINVTSIEEANKIKSMKLWAVITTL
jgi:hypothetical protein